MPRRSYRLAGGDFAGAGAYGCFYTTSFPPVEPRAGYGAKILESHSARMEEDQSKPFRAADPEGKYGVYGSRARPVDLGELARGAGGQAELDKCPTTSEVGKAIREGGLRLQQIVSKVGTGDMLQLYNQSLKHRGAMSPKEKVQQMTDHLGAARNLIVGLKRYHDAQLAHLDVKQQNAVGFGFGDSGAPRVYKWIDFGFSASYAHLRRLADKSHPLEMKDPYFAWPALMTAYMQGSRGRFLHDLTLREFFRDRSAMAELERVAEAVDKDLPFGRMKYRGALAFAAAWGLTEDSPPAQVRYALLRATDVFAASIMLHYLFRLGSQQLEELGHDALHQKLNDVLWDARNMAYTPDGLLDAVDDVLADLAEAGFRYVPTEDEDPDDSTPEPEEREKPYVETLREYDDGTLIADMCVAASNVVYVLKHGGDLDGVKAHLASACTEFLRRFTWPPATKGRVWRRAQEFSHMDLKELLSWFEPQGKDIEGAQSSADRHTELHIMTELCRAYLALVVPHDLSGGARRRRSVRRH